VHTQFSAIPQVCEQSVAGVFSHIRLQLLGHSCMQLPVLPALQVI